MFLFNAGLGTGISKLSPAVRALHNVELGHLPIRVKVVLLSQYPLILNMLLVLKPVYTHANRHTQSLSLST